MTVNTKLAKYAALSKEGSTEWEYFATRPMNDIRIREKDSKREGDDDRHGPGATPSLSIDLQLVDQRAAVNL